jgi:aldose 1-epimerase
MTEERKAESRYLTIDNGRGLKGTFSTYGAGVKALTLNGEPLILELSDSQKYLTADQFFGKTLGRVAGRIPDSGMIGNAPYHVLGDKKHICLHGGVLESLSYRDFNATVLPTKKGPAVQFEYLSPDGECGFPGNLTVKITYFLPNDSDAITIRLEAVSDKDTLVNLCNHMYWNIFRSLNVNDYVMQVKASKYGVFKKGCQLIVKSAPVPEYLDFRKPVSLKTRLDQIEKAIPEIGTLDHTFLFDKADPKEAQVILDTPKLTVETYTDYDAVNFYVDSSMTPVAFTNRKDFGKRRAIAIEPELFPLDNLVLKAGQKYSHFMTFKLIRK